MFFVYILKSLRDGNLYIGKTNNIQRRLKEHNTGHTQSLKNRIPMMLLETIECKNETEAVQLEREYKKSYKREEIKRRYGI